MLRVHILAKYRFFDDPFLLCTANSTVLKFDLGFGRILGRSYEVPFLRKKSVALLRKKGPQIRNGRFFLIPIPPSSLRRYAPSSLSPSTQPYLSVPNV